jgi:hypothetical protein
MDFKDDVRFVIIALAMCVLVPFTLISSLMRSLFLSNKKEVKNSKFSTNTWKTFKK